MSREPETNRYPHLSLFVCFCLLVCKRNAKAFTCSGFLFVFFRRREVITFFRALSYGPHIPWTLLSYTIRLKIHRLIFDRLLNSNRLKNLPSGIFSSNTDLEWPHGCSCINTWTMKCPLKHALVQENLFAK